MNTKITRTMQGTSETQMHFVDVLVSTDHTHYRVEILLNSETHHGSAFRVTRLGGRSSRTVKTWKVNSEILENAVAAALAHVSIGKAKRLDRWPLNQLDVNLCP